MRRHRQVLACLLALAGLFGLSDVGHATPDGTGPRAVSRPRDGHAIAPVLQIGLLIPKSGALSAQGIDALRGAEMAVAEANASGGRRFALLVQDDNDPWGAGTRAMVRLAFDDHVIGLIGGMDRRSAHLIEQVAVKSRVLFVALNADDPTITTAGVPWALRIAPKTSPRISPRFMARYRLRYGTPPSPFAALAHDAVTLITRVAMRNQGRQGRDGALTHIRFVGVTGVIRFDKRGDRVSH